MKICRKFDIKDTINSLEEWFQKCPPQGKEKHCLDKRIKLLKEAIFPDIKQEVFESLKYQLIKVIGEIKGKNSIKQKMYAL